MGNTSRSINSISIYQDFSDFWPNTSKKTVIAVGSNKTDMEGYLLERPGILSHSRVDQCARLGTEILDTVFEDPHSHIPLFLDLRAQPWERQEDKVIFNALYKFKWGELISSLNAKRQHTCEMAYLRSWTHAKPKQMGLITLERWRAQETEWGKGCDLLGSLQWPISNNKIKFPLGLDADGNYGKWDDHSDSPPKSRCVAWIEGRWSWAYEGVLPTLLGHNVTHSKENLDHKIESQLCEFCS